MVNDLHNANWWYIMISDDTWGGTGRRSGARKSQAVSSIVSRDPSGDRLCLGFDISYFFIFFLSGTIWWNLIRIFFMFCIGNHLMMGFVWDLISHIFFFFVYREPSDDWICLGFYISYFFLSRTIWWNLIRIFLCFVTGTIWWDWFVPNFFILLSWFSSWLVSTKKKTSQLGLS